MVHATYGVNYVLRKCPEPQMSIIDWAATYSHQVIEVTQKKPPQIVTLTLS